MGADERTNERTNERTSERTSEHSLSREERESKGMEFNGDHTDVLVPRRCGRRLPPERRQRWSCRCQSSSSLFSMAAYGEMDESRVRNGSLVFVGTVMKMMIEGLPNHQIARTPVRLYACTPVRT